MLFIGVYFFLTGSLSGRAAFFFLQKWTESAIMVHNKDKYWVGMYLRDLEVDT